MYGNNHHSIVEFRGVYYLLYHNRPVEKAMGITGNYRSPQIDVLLVGEDGSLGPVKGTMAGVSQLMPLDPYQVQSAQTMQRQAGIEVTGYADTALTVATTGDWLEVAGAEFSRGAAAFTLCAGSENGGAVRVLAGQTVLCEIALPAGTAMGMVTVPCASVSGQTNITLVFAGDVTASCWQFAAE